MDPRCSFAMNFIQEPGVFSQKGVDVLQLITYLGNLLLSNIDCETTAKATALNDQSPQSFIPKQFAACPLFLAVAHCPPGFPAFCTVSTVVAELPTSNSVRDH